MCGIAGILNLQNQEPVSQRLLIAMRDTMIHRGPDGAGVWIAENGQVGLAHRRLSILDLSEAASQPMSDNGGRIWITFNGEIYNHREIREELIASGCANWKTDHSDTEVIIRAYQQWGIDCINRFRGMFAFALWDGVKRELWLVRDRMGVKPLYWAQFNGKFYFASEIKAILEDKSIPRRMNEEAAFHYLTFMTSPAPLTMFNGVQKLQAGFLMKVTPDGSVTEKCWWDLFDGVEKNRDLSEDEWAERLLAELEESVRYRAVSDVPVGVFLSGGIDSSTNAALFNKISKGGRIKTFTIGYKNAKSYANEHEYARKMANIIGSDHYELDLTLRDLIDFLPRLVYHQDEPIGDPVCVPIYYVSELAKKNNITVAQVGEGADELFWGYPRWRFLYYLQKLNNIPGLGFAKRAAMKMLSAAGREDKEYYDWLRRGERGQRIFWSGAQVFSEAPKLRVLSSRMRSEYSGRSSYEIISQLYGRYAANTPETSDLDWMTYSDLRLRLPELLLMRVDKMTMAASVEGRVPFLDHRFVQLALSIPESVKTRRGNLKHILKKAVRGLIPDDLIDRKKQGFGVPVTEWMMAELQAHAMEAVSEFCDGTDLLDKKEAVKLIDSRDKNAWYLLNLALWWRRFFK